MSASGRHRASSSVLLLPVIVSTLIGAVLGAGVVAAAASDPEPDPPAPPVIAQAVAPSDESASPAAIQRSVESVGFGETATDPTGLTVMVLPPEKVKGGVQLTISLINNSNTPITINTGDLGPHDIRFDGETMPMSMTPAKKKIMPGEGYTYQCGVQLPTMDPGYLELIFDSATVAGQAAGD